MPEEGGGDGLRKVVPRMSRARRVGGEAPQDPYTVMVSKAKLAALGPSKLSQALAQLNTQPKLTLNATRSLRLSYAFRNDHFGARYGVANLERILNGQRSFYRHFAKDYLPRIRYANPALNIQVEKARKTPQEAWRPAMEVEFSMPFPCGIHGPLFN